MIKGKISILKKIVCALCAIFFVVAGSLHFSNPSPYVDIVPEYLPFPLSLVYLSGILEIAGGIGLLIPPLRRFASWGLIALLIAVFPANLNMAMNSIDFGMPHYILWWRLPFQILFIVWVWWCGKE
jgi:uncharacterized membrane protein